MKTIRVKEENQAAIVSALVDAGYEAKPSCETPLTEWESDNNSFSDFEDQTFNSLIGMKGVETTATGHQAHRVIKTLKQQGVIQ